MMEKTIFCHSNKQGGSGAFAANCIIPKEPLEICRFKVSTLFAMVSFNPQIKSDLKTLTKSMFDGLNLSRTRSRGNVGFQLNSPTAFK
ncbi:hypothetical protein HHI36_019654 [Cryptolaemus montrouzieri]|uniref:Uncharacterized protein n=1 Tax=Cryptolaemus montrouzieri TaxID=559131 RepID=A0ABD2N8S1_9CUCU